MIMNINKTFIMSDTRYIIKRQFKSNVWWYFTGAGWSKSKNNAKEWHVKKTAQRNADKFQNVIVTTKHEG